MKENILILCTGNSCRSQMVEGFLKAFDSQLQVFSAGTKPSNQVHPLAIETMKDLGIDISKNHPKLVDEFITKSFDYVITVCGEAKENCPIFIGEVKYRLHIGFEDPDKAIGTNTEIQAEFKRIRDQILSDFFKFYHTQIKK